MTKIIIWIFIIGIAWLLQTILALNQIKKFNNELRKLQNFGTISIGKYKGMFFSGCIVLLASKNNIVQTGKILEGFTVFSTVKDFNLFNGINLNDIEITLKELNLNYSRRKAISNIFLEKKQIKGDI